MIKYLFIFTSFFLLQGDVIEELSWHEDYKLTWDDFKGQPNLDTDAVAVTASGITFSYSVKKSETKIHGFQTLVKAFFYPEHSWCKSNLVDEHVLGHEQLHFDITELHARIFRQKIVQLKPHIDIAKSLQNLHENIETELKSTQNAYDSESNYSIDTVGQQKWQLDIAKRLKTLERYKSKD